MFNAMLVGIGGVLGAWSRFYLGVFLAQRLGAAFPYGTLIINVTGCFVLGLVGTLAAERASLVTPEVRLLVGVGFCGAYTTFSTFGFETVALLRTGALAEAALYVVGSNALGLGAVYVGFLLARLAP